MANAPNPYYYDPSVGAAASNIAAAIFGNPDKAAQQEYTDGRTAYTAQQTADLAHKARSRNSVESALLGFDPKDPHNGDKIRAVAAGLAGSENLSDLNKAILGLVSNLGGTDDQKVNALVGDGHTLGKDDAVSLEGQDAIRTGNFGQETAIKNSELANALLMNREDNTQSGANTAANNARALEERRLQEAGSDRRWNPTVAAGSTGYFSADNPAGLPTEVHGLPTVDTQKAGIIENAVGAGFGTDPSEMVVPGSVLGAAMGVTGNGASGPKLVTNDKGDRVVDAPNVHVGLPGGKPNTPHNYRTPDNKILLSTDGQTVLGHPDQPLPPGTVQVGSMPAAPTEFQGKAAGFALAMDGAMQGIQALPPGFDPTNAVMQLTAGTNAPFTATDISAKFQDPQQQRYMRAVTEMLAIILRGDSGAAINPDEFVRYGKIYVPQIGEDPLVMGDKWKALNARKEAYVTQAGGWYEAAQQRISQNPVGATWGSSGAVDLSTVADPDAAYGALPSGAQFKAPDGTTRTKP